MNHVNYVLRFLVFRSYRSSQRKIVKKCRSRLFPFEARRS